MHIGDRVGGGIWPSAAAPSRGRIAKDCARQRPVLVAAVASLLIALFAAAAAVLVRGLVF